MPPGRFCVYMEPRANLARSPAPVPLSAALRFGHSSIPNTETEVHNEGNQFAGFLPVVYGRCDGRSHGESCGRIAGGPAVHQASRRRIYRNKAHYRNPFSLQGRDMLLALFFLLYALICILILLLRTSRHRTSVQFTCVFNTQNTTFSGFIFVSRKLLYFEAQESVVLRFQPVCIAVRSIPHKLL